MAKSKNTSIEKRTRKSTPAYVVTGEGRQAQPTEALQASIKEEITKVQASEFTPVANSAALSSITNPTKGDFARTDDNNTIYRFDGTNWAVFHMDVVGSGGGSATVLDYKGGWDPAANTPTLSNGVGTTGFYYRVTANSPGFTLDGTSDWKIGDTVFFDGSAWRKLDHTTDLSIGAVTQATVDVDSSTGSSATIPAVAPSTNGAGGSAGVISAQDKERLDSTLTYQGGWDAAANSPNLVTATPVKGDYYDVTTTGTTNLSGISQWSVGDTVFYTGSAWVKLDHTTDLSAGTITQTTVAIDSSTGSSATIPAAAPSVSGVGGSAGALIATDKERIDRTLNYQGAWDATTNSPALTTATPSNGDYYRVSVAGNTSLGGIAQWSVGDIAVYLGSSWQKLDHTTDLSIPANTATTLELASSTGTNVTLTGATSGVGGVAGLLVAADKDRIDSGLIYRGPWNASGTSAPSATPAKGDSYLVTTAGSFTLSGQSSWRVGDLVFWDGTAWKRVGNDQDHYQGLWNAATNTPNISATTPLDGYIYVVSTTGTTALSGISDWVAGDALIYDAATTSWQKLDNAARNITLWAGSTAYKKGQVVVTETGALVAKIADGSSGATFNSALWTLIAPDVNTKTWTANKYYYVGQTATSPTGAKIRRTTAGTAGAAFNDTEAGMWEFISQDAVSPFVANAVYMAGEEVFVDGATYAHNLSGAAGAAFNAAESAQWTLTGDYATIEDWTAGKFYRAGALVITPTGALVKRIAAGDADATAFDAVEAGKWVVISPDAQTRDFIGNAYYYKNQVARPSSVGFPVSVEAQVIVERETAGLSGATYDGTEAGNWTVKDQYAITGWQGGKVYTKGQNVSYFGFILTRNISGLAKQESPPVGSDLEFYQDWFSSTGAPNWSPITQNYNSNLDELIRNPVYVSGFSPISLFARRVDTSWANGHRWSVVNVPGTPADYLEVDISGVVFVGGPLNVYQAQWETEEVAFTNFNIAVALIFEDPVGTVVAQVARVVRVDSAPSISNIPASLPDTGITVFGATVKAVRRSGSKGIIIDIAFSTNANVNTIGKRATMRFYPIYNVDGSPNPLNGVFSESYLHEFRIAEADKLNHFDHVPDVIRAKQNSPPASAVRNEAYIVGNAASGLWLGAPEDSLVIFNGVYWELLLPELGARYRYGPSGSGVEVIFNGTKWYIIRSPVTYQYRTNSTTNFGVTRTGALDNNNQNLWAELPDANHEVWVTRGELSIREASASEGIGGTRIATLVLELVNDTNSQYFDVVTTKPDTAPGTRSWIKGSAVGSIEAPLVVGSFVGAARGIQIGYRNDTVNVGQTTTEGGFAGASYASLSGYIVEKIP